MIIQSTKLTKVFNLSQFTDNNMASKNVQLINILFSLYISCPNIKKLLTITL